MLHIVQGDQEQDKKWLERAAHFKLKLRTPSWVVPKIAQIGEGRYLHCRLWIFRDGSCQIGTEASPRLAETVWCYNSFGKAHLAAHFASCDTAWPP
jgi:hypothetical protein